MTAKTPTQKEADRMAVAFLESACFKDSELDHALVQLIRKGCATFTAPDLFEITERGMNQVETDLNG